MADLLNLSPVQTLLSRVRAEPRAGFVPGRPIRLSRAPGRLDVMGGIADSTGSLVCAMPLDRAAIVATQARDDRAVHVFSFNRLDAGEPFMASISLESLAREGFDAASRAFSAPGRAWAARLVGCLLILHDRGLINLADPRHGGLNLAQLCTVPSGAGVGSSAAIVAATMMNLADHFGIDRARLGGLALAELCRAVESRVVGASCEVTDCLAGCLGETDVLLRVKCQPHDVLPSVRLPENVRLIGINSGVKHGTAAGRYARTRCAAFMGHAIVLDRMRQMGAAASRELTGDPMGGYLANLDPDDYKRLFRPTLPGWIEGRAFLDQYGETMDAATGRVEPGTDYPVQHAVDHHVLEARRVRRFVEFIERAEAAPQEPATRGSMLDRAGHLMYASHLSYGNDAMLGAPECDVLVDLVRRRESAGLYGARITAGGSGGTVAVLCRSGDRADAAIAEIISDYTRRTGARAEALTGSSAGAWHVGTAVA